MGSNSTAAKRYICSVSDTLSCSGKAKKQIVFRIRDGVEDYLLQNQNADFEMLQKHFGTPQEIAASYVDEQDAAELLKKMSIKKKVLVIVAGAMAAILLMWIGTVTWAATEAQKTNRGHVVETAEMN